MVRQLHMLTLFRHAIRCENQMIKRHIRYEPKRNFLKSSGVNIYKSKPRDSAA